MTPERAATITMDSSLGAKQELFSWLFGKLLAKIHREGYDARIGHVYRTDPKYKPRLHAKKLAGDVNLFKDGVFLQATEDHRRFGEWWESLHPLCSWGGRFNDGNHYSVRHGRMR